MTSLENCRNSNHPLPRHYNNFDYHHHSNNNLNTFSSPLSCKHDFDPTFIIEAETIHHLPLPMDHPNYDQEESFEQNPVKSIPTPPPQQQQQQQLHVVPSSDHEHSIDSPSEHASIPQTLPHVNNKHTLTKRKNSLPSEPSSFLPKTSSFKMNSNGQPNSHLFRHEEPITSNYDQQKGQPNIDSTHLFRTNSQPQTNHLPAHSPQNSAFPLPMFLNPFQAFDKMKQEGIRKSKLAFDQIVILSLFAGCFAGIGGALSLLTAGNCPTLEKENPGLQKFFFGA